MSIAVSRLPLQGVCVALERARQLRGLDDGPWSIGVRDARGELLASAMLDSYAQVKAFARAMEDLGLPHSLGAAHEDAPSCDFSFRLREAVAAGDLLHA